MKIRNRKAIRAIAYLLAMVFRSWFRLVRLRVVCEVPESDPYGDASRDRFLYCLWHDAIVGVLFSRPHRRMAGLVSLHADGSYVADLMEIFGIRAIRGSSGRRGAGAMREMLSAADDWHIAITSDGPRGPRREAKDGIVYLAAHSGRAIVPVSFAARRAWRPRGRWTDMLVPLPWTRSLIVAGRPIHIPAGLTRNELGPWRDLIQCEMEALHALAERIARQEVNGFFANWRTAVGFPELPEASTVRRAA
ncbi:MAG: DUF374 domain-containing protein [Planctomycetaceae bacterium]|nr:DUF374 domain-containing protein [Planctomycetaceae bacterium]